MAATQYIKRAHMVKVWLLFDNRGLDKMHNVRDLNFVADGLQQEKTTLGSTPIS